MEFLYTKVFKRKRLKRHLQLRKVLDLRLVELQGLNLSGLHQVRLPHHDIEIEAIVALVRLVATTKENGKIVLGNSNI